MLTLPTLPYGYDELEPVVSAATMRLHHDKHHAAYVAKTNDLAANAGMADRSLEEILAAAGSIAEKALFNNAAQAWNHAFFWLSMTPMAPPPSGDLTRRIGEVFGDHSAFRQAFVEAGLGHFGSGWVWLVEMNGHLALTTTHDAQNFVTSPAITPLLVCDVWEHAYYLDYQNDRKRFLEGWFDRIANWSFAASRLMPAAGAALKTG